MPQAAQFIREASFIAAAYVLRYRGHPHRRILHEKPEIEIDESIGEGKSNMRHEDRIEIQLFELVADDDPNR